MSIKRREFIKGGALGTIALGAAVNARPASAQIAGANDRIRLGVIGTGRQGRSNLQQFLKYPEVEAVALCDVYAPNLEKTAALAPRAERFTDFRRLLDRKDIDAVMVATPDHWHALQTVMACQAGKDVYVEKPTSLDIAEGRVMVEAARDHKRVVQVGTWQRSGTHFREATEIVRSGRLGKVASVRVWNVGNQFPAGIGNPPDSAPPPDLDWDMWLGPAPKRAFNANRFGVTDKGFSYFRWFWDYAGGKMTDWGVHLLDIVQWAMNVDAPQSVTATGGKFLLQDNRETPDTLNVIYGYPGFVCTYEYRETNSNPLYGGDHGIVFYGTEGTLHVSRGGFELMPEKRKGMTPIEELKVKGEKGDQMLATHVRDFLDCMRTRRQPVCDIEIGHRSSSTAMLGNVAYRSRRHIGWDGARERLTEGGDAAAKYLSTPYRKPWRLKA